MEQTVHHVREVSGSDDSSWLALLVVVAAIAVVLGLLAYGFFYTQATPQTPNDGVNTTIEYNPAPIAPVAPAPTSPTPTAQ